MATKNLAATRLAGDPVPAEAPAAPQLHHGQIDPQDEPSVEWGWHGSFPRGTRLAGWFSAIVLLAMNIGNHTGWVEGVYLDVIAVFIIGGLVADIIRRRTAWRS